MFTMVDELFDRQYQSGRGELNAAIVGSLARLGHAVSNAFEVLAKIEYESPWTLKSKKARCN
jgi:hypothetical protein